MSDKYLYIHTIGCQMNVYDSDRIVSSLVPLDFKLTESLEKADLIITNTCAIRAKAEQKVFSFIGRLARLKRKKPGLIIGVGGCVAQQEGNKIIKRMPSVDIVFGTKAIGRLPGMVQTVMSKRCRIVDVEMTEGMDEYQSLNDDSLEGDPARFVTIMQGCDNYCTYCVVPYVRGRETSRHPDQILEEIECLVQQGVREVTLLGQNVNSYGVKEGLCSFPDLLARINKVDRLLRIRFTTSHPKDLSLDLVRSFKKLEKLSPHIHLPVQSGSDRILKRMNRGYTRGHYIEKIKNLRDVRPDIAITTDFIVGFPGETESEFHETLDLIKEVGFDSLFAFQYSDRPSAPAARFSDKVPEAVKKGRLQDLLNLQEQITLDKHKILVGTTQEVLVEGISKQQSVAGPGELASRIDLQLSGRTPTNKIVNFNPEQQPAPCEDSLTGRLVRVKIHKAFLHSLWGRPVKLETRSSPSKGDKSYAA